MRERLHARDTLKAGLLHALAALKFLPMRRLLPRIGKEIHEVTELPSVVRDDRPVLLVLVHGSKPVQQPLLPYAASLCALWHHRHLSLLLSGARVVGSGRPSRSLDISAHAARAALAPAPL